MSYRIIQAVALLICFRIITLDYGVDTYGFVSLFMTFAAYFIFFDFGVVSYLRSEIPRAYTLHGETHANAVAREGLKGLLIYAGTSYLIALALFFLTDLPVRLLQKLIKSPELVSAHEIRNSIVALLIYALMMVMGNLVLAILSARGKQFQYYYLMMIGAIIQVIVVAIAAKWHADVDVLFIILLTSSLLPLTWLIVREIRHVLANYDHKVRIRTLNGTSNSFFIVQIGGLIANNADVLIVAHLFSIREVAIYATMKLIIQLPISLHGNYIMQSWPLFSSMRAENRWSDIRSLLKSRIYLTLSFSMAVATLIVLIIPYLIRVWSNGAMEIGRIVAFSFASLLVFYMYSACYSILIFAFNYLKPLVFLVFLVLPVLYGVSAAGERMGFGIESVVIANMVVQTFGLAVGLFFYHWRLGEQAYEKSA